MGSSIERAESEVQRALEHAIEVTQREEVSLAAVEKELWTALLALGRALIGLFLARVSASTQATTYECGGAPYVTDAKTCRTSEVGTRFGKVKFCRAVGCRVGGRARVDLPVDRKIGLTGGFSLGTMASIAQLGAMLAFGSARRLFREFHEWVPSSRATLRIIDGVGARARGFLDAADSPCDDGEVLVIQVDGRGAPMITTAEARRRRQPRSCSGGTKRHRRRQHRRQHPRPRRMKGDKSKNAKVAFVGVLYTLRKTRHGFEGPINKRLIATFESHEALFRWLYEHAVRRGYGKKRTLFLADGSEHIWRWQKVYFSDAIACVDWYHVVEKLWTAGSCLHREGTQALATWVAEQQKRLRRGQISRVLTELDLTYAAVPKTGPGSKGKRIRLGNIIKHLSEHRNHMPYAHLRREDLDIGTGAVEGAVRNLVGIRLDGPGMRWGRERAELVLLLRCIVLNGQWDAFSHYISCKPVQLPAQPIPARTHDTRAELRRQAA